MTNRTIFTGDNLTVMRGLNSDSVDLIYLDPPYNSNRNYSAPIGSEAAGASFKDAWTLDDVDHAWHGEIADREPALYQTIAAAGLSHSKGMQAYLIMMAVRMLEMRRILKPCGSIFLHVDPTASHYLKALMDSIFGREAFRNEIVWCYTGPGSPKMRQFNRKHDTIFWYANGDTWTFNKDDVRIPYKPGIEGKLRKTSKNVWGALTAEQAKAYADSGKIPESWWTDFPASWYMSKREKLGYPTQKPVSLLERIVKASSNEGDIVFDPFCGCATSLIAAEKHGRQWIGCDLSELAIKLVRKRLSKECGDLICDVTHRTDIPMRTDQGRLPHYRTHKHTLFGQQEGVCNGCLTRFDFRNFEVDHRIPRKHGGSDHIENLQLLCGHCNRLKGAGTHVGLVAKLVQQGIRPERLAA